MKIIQLLSTFVLLIDEDQQAVYLVGLDAVFDTQASKEDEIAKVVISAGVYSLGNEYVKRNSITGHGILKTLKEDYLRKNRTDNVG